MAGWVGRKLGKVNVELLLARGGMAEVYLGRHSALQRAVAIKVMNSQYADDPELLDRFQREARVVAMLRHPNIVQVHDFDSVDGRPYLVMEYVPGVSLATHMRSLHTADSRMDSEAIDRLIGQIAGALQYAHERGVIHRDIKPANILLTSPTAPIVPGKSLPPDFQAVLTDFGLVRFLSSAQQTSAGKIAGTPAYMSPEQASGLTVDASTDVYSLGIVLYELLAGRVPFEADSTLAVLQMHVNQAPPKVPDLPGGVQEVLDTALAKNPAARFRSAPELAQAFHEARLSSAEAPTLAMGKPPALESRTHAPGPTRLRTMLSTALIGVAVIALAGVVGIRTLILPGEPAPVSGGSAAVPEADEYKTAAEPGDPIGLLRFQDGAALVDEVSFRASGMPRPPAGYQYEVWLISEGGEEQRPVGYLPLDVDGNGTVSFVDPEGRNLLSLYTGVQITLEPDPDPSPNPSATVSYKTSLPEDAIIHIRHILVSFPKAPNAQGLLDGLVKDTDTVSLRAKDMLAAFEAGNETATRSDAEMILNALVGSQSPDHADWDGDGTVEDPSDGFGLLLNGDNAGYIQGSYSHTEFAASAPDATENMQSHGNHVTVTADNLLQWAPQLRDLVRQILTSPFDASTGGLIRQAVALSDNMLSGTDLNGNERVEAITGEGGAQTAYQHALYMADLVITLPK